jgi:hydroxymethylbilane synthase
MHSGLKLGTRGSPLALAQARKVAAALETAQRWPADMVDIVAIKTSGDRIQDRPLTEIGGKMLWTKELDQALLRGDVDFNVHSMKDVESERPAGIHLAALRPRGDVRDRLIGAASIEAIPHGARFGTSSPRRSAQMRRMRPDLEIVPLRGNIQTRMAKVEAGEVDVTLLASVGLKRLGIVDVGVPIPVEVLLPAPGQGALGLECRTDDTMTQSVLSTVNNPVTYWAVMAERAFTRALGGTCHSPVAALALLDDGALRMRAQLYSEDGSEMIEDKAGFECGDETTPRELALRMIERAPEAIRRLFNPA